MGCCGARKPRTLSPPRTQPTMPATTTDNYPQPKPAKHETILSIPNCKVCLMDEGEAIELATGDFTLIQLSDDDVLLATIIKINDDLQWPLTKDEPVVKLDPLHYLFSLRVIKEDDPLSYGVTFSETSRGDFKLLDKFLKEHSCFSTSSSSRKTDLDWKEFAPKVDAYNNFLAKAIAGGTGHIVRGIFTCSNAYTNQVSFMLRVHIIGYTHMGKGGKMGKKVIYVWAKRGAFLEFITDIYTHEFETGAKRR